MDRERRAFLSGASLSTERRTRYQRACEPLGPLPPWHWGRMLQAQCAACAAPCVEACPEKIVRVHGADHALSGLPYLAFERGGCTWCGACAAACPVTQASGAGRSKLGEVRLDRARCLSWNGVVCISCVSRCIYRAIGRDRSGRVTLKAAACTGCGACIAACPVPGALTLNKGINKAIKGSVTTENDFHFCGGLISMELDDFEASLSKDRPPEGLTPALEALWYEARGDWDRGHRMVQDIRGSGAAWVHAYLHRKEGDTWNADYWYGHAGRKRPSLSLDAEWRSLVTELLREQPE
jgi:ferredoxin